VTDNPDKGWKVLSGKEDAENIPLWMALAQLTSDNLNEGLKNNESTIRKIKPIFIKYYNISSIVSIAFGVASIVFFLSFLIFIHLKDSISVLYIALAFLAVAFAPQFWRFAYQYSIKIVDAPLALPHAADQHFEEFLSYLQRADGPQVYYLARFRKKRIPVNRRQFFGRLRYFLFSEHASDRAMVIRYPGMKSMTTDLYLHRENVERMIALGVPKRKSGPGRLPKYPYIEALLDVRDDPRLAALDLNDETKATSFITDRLVEWFEAASDETGEMPKRDRLTPYAKKIYDHLKKLAARKTR